MGKYSLYIDDVSVEAVFNKLGGVEGAKRFLRGELVVSEPDRTWREEDGVIYFSVTSDGTTGEAWITRIESKGFCLSEYAKSVLRSPDFVPTNGIATEVAMLKGSLFTDADRITENIRAGATKREFTTPNAEVACLVREKFTDKEIAEMGLWYITTMHESINDSGNNPGLLTAGRSDDGSWLDAYDDRPDGWWYRDSGFAFVAP